MISTNTTSRLDISKKVIIGDDALISPGQGEAFGRDPGGFEAEIVAQMLHPYRYRSSLDSFCQKSIT